MDRILEFSSNHPLLVIGFLAVLGLLLWTEVTRKLRGVPELSPAEAVPWINDPNAVVVDISPAAEFNRGHIVNARNIQSSRLASPDAEVAKLKEHKILLVCKSGQSASAAAQSLRKLGAAEVAVLKGGMTQWRSDQFPVTSKK
jgi:rhodanese-related sulfurtransferase